MAHAQDWGLVIQEVCTFMNADVAMPMPRSPGTAISFKPHFRCSASGPEASAAPYQRRLRAAVLASYQHRQVKIAELPVDVFRFMQTLEWQLEGENGQGVSSNEVATPVMGAGVGSRVGPQPVTANNSMADMGTLSSSLASHSSGTAPSSPSINPPKTMLYRTTTPTLLSTLHSLAAGSAPMGSSGGASNVPLDRESVLLLYVAASSLRGRLAAARGQAHPEPTHYPPEYARTICLSPPRASTATSSAAAAAPISGSVQGQRGSSAAGGCLGCGLVPTRANSCHVPTRANTWSVLRISFVFTTVVVRFAPELCW